MAQSEGGAPAMFNSHSHPEPDPKHDFPMEDNIVAASEFQENAEGRPHEECGVFGIYAPGVDVARRTYFGLFALQHRGQESAGIAVTDGRKMRMHNDMGLVSQVFDNEILASLKGDIAVGHTRYSTTGSSELC